MKRLALTAAVLTLVFLALSCNGGDDSPSSRDAIQTYFTGLDGAWHAHLARLQSFTPIAEYGEANESVLVSIDQMLRDIDGIDPPPEARDAQRRLVGSWDQLIAEMRRSIEDYGATATRVPGQTESPSKDAIDQACADIAAIAVANSVQSDFMCLADRDSETTSTTGP